MEGFTEKNPKWFYDLNETPELKILEDNYHTILEELLQLRQNSENGYWLDTFPAYLHPDSKNKWKVFTFQIQQFDSSVFNIIIGSFHFHHFY